MEYTYFFEIAVYRCSPDKFKREAVQRRQKAIENAPERWKLWSPERIKQIVQELEAKPLWYPHPWDYNEAVGWLRLFFLGFPGRIQIDYFFVDYKHIPQIMGRKRFEHCPSVDVADIEIEPEMSSEEIYHEIDNTLTWLNRVDPFTGRYFDLGYFHNIGPFVDWRRLVDVLGS